MLRLVPEMLVVVGVCRSVAAPAPVRKKGVAAASVSVAPAPLSIVRRSVRRGRKSRSRSSRIMSLLCVEGKPPRIVPGYDARSGDRIISDPTCQARTIRASGGDRYWVMRGGDRELG